MRFPDCRIPVSVRMKAATPDPQLFEQGVEFAYHVSVRRGDARNPTLCLENVEALEAPQHVVPTQLSVGRQIFSLMQKTDCFWGRLGNRLGTA